MCCIAQTRPTYQSSYSAIHVSRRIIESFKRLPCLVCIPVVADHVLYFQNLVHNLCQRLCKQICRLSRHLKKRLGLGSDKRLNILLHGCQLIVHAHRNFRHENPHDPLLHCDYSSRANRVQLKLQITSTDIHMYVCKTSPPPCDQEKKSVS